MAEEIDYKERLHGFGKDERDYNEHEYEPEEYCGVDFVEKETKLEHIHAVVDEGQEECGEDHVQHECVENHLRNECGEGHLQSECGEGHLQNECGEGHLQNECGEDHLQNKCGEGHLQNECGEGHLQDKCGEVHLQEEEDDMPELEHFEKEIECDQEDEHEMADADEKDEHHKAVNKRHKRKEFDVFVGGLDKDATEDDLKRIFSQVGEIAKIRLLTNPYTGKNKGFAFLGFSTVEQAKRAITELKNPVINGKQCGVMPCKNSDTLFLGNICKTWTKEALKEELKLYGVQNLENVTLVKDTYNEGMSRGFAFLKFPSRSEALDACKLLQKRNVFFGVDRPAKVMFAESFNEPGYEIMAEVKTVFVDGLAPSWDEDHVCELLKKYGKIEKIDLASSMPYAKRSDYGFVTFDSHDAAVTCADSLNDTDLGDGDDKARVRARLSRPIYRVKSRQVGRRDFSSKRWPQRPVRCTWDRSVRESSGGHGSRVSPSFMKRPIGLRDRRPFTSDLRGRFRFCEKRSAPLTVSSYRKSSLNRDYGRCDHLPPSRSRAIADYASTGVADRHFSYRNDYPSPRYSDLPRSSSHTSAGRSYVNDEYARFKRRPPSYRGVYANDYDSVSGIKRPYSALDGISVRHPKSPPHYSASDVIPPRFADTGVSHPRDHAEYGYRGATGNYEDTYENRGTIPDQNLNGPYGNRQDIDYGGSYVGSEIRGGSYVGSEIRGMYSSSRSGDFMSRGRNVDGSPYTSYSNRDIGGSDHMEMGGLGSYY